MTGTSAQKKRVETNPAAQACCQLLAFDGGGVPAGGTASAGGKNAPDSVGGPATGPLQLM